MLWTGEQGAVEIGSLRDLQRQVGALDPTTNPFGVLTRGGSDYIQVAAEGSGFVVEKRKGGEDTHVHARRTGGHPSPRAPKPGFLARLFGGGGGGGDVDTFSLKEVEAVLGAWYEGRPEPDFLRWEKGYA